MLFSPLNIDIKKKQMFKIISHGHQKLVSSMHWPLWEYCKSGKHEIRNTKEKVYAQYSHAQILVSCLSKILSFGLILIAKYYEIFVYRSLYTRGIGILG